MGGREIIARNGVSRHACETYPTNQVGSKATLTLFNRSWE